MVKTGCTRHRNSSTVQINGVGWGRLDAAGREESTLVVVANVRYAHRNRQLSAAGTTWLARWGLMKLGLGDVSGQCPFHSRPHLLYVLRHHGKISTWIH